MKPVEQEYCIATSFMLTLLVIFVVILAISQSVHFVSNAPIDFMLIGNAKHCIYSTEMCTAKPGNSEAQRNDVTEF